MADHTLKLEWISNGPCVLQYRIVLAYLEHDVFVFQCVVDDVKGCFCEDGGRGGNSIPRHHNTASACSVKYTRIFRKVNLANGILGERAEWFFNPKCIT